jgi:hypothetical protein
MHSDAVVREEEDVSPVLHQSLAACRASLVTMRAEDRRHGTALSPETGRLLETVGQALAQGGGVIPAADIDAIEILTGIPARYRVTT